MFSAWLELFISKGNVENIDFAFGIHGQNYPIIIKEKAADFMKNILNDNDLALYLKVSVGPIASERWRRQEPEFAGAQKTKLIRELAGNRDASNICMLIQFSHGQMQKLLLLFVRGGPINYQVKADSGISEDWILTFIVPAIASKYCRSVSLVLVRALLWRIFDEVQNFSVPDNIFRRVNNYYQDLGEMCRFTEEENIVENVPLIATGSTLIYLLKMMTWRMTGILLVEEVLVSCFHVKLIASN